jgi:hypothetical protein
MLLNRPRGRVPNGESGASCDELSALRLDGNCARYSFPPMKTVEHLHFRSSLLPGIDQVVPAYIRTNLKFRPSIFTDGDHAKYATEAAPQCRRMTLQSHILALFPCAAIVGERGHLHQVSGLTALSVPPRQGRRSTENDPEEHPSIDHSLILPPPVPRQGDPTEGRLAV